MSSPVLLDKPFNLGNYPLNQFFSLGSPVGNRGLLHTGYFSKKPAADLVEVQAGYRLNGLCTYAFIVSAGLICGFLTLSPVSSTVIKHSALVIGNEAEEYKPHYHLQQQGVLIMESTCSSVVLASLNAESPLLVKVDL